MSLLSERILTKVLPPSLCRCLAFSVSPLTETLFDDLKGRLCFFHYSNIPGLDISVRPRHPPYVSDVPACMWKKQRPECTETFMHGLFLLQGIFPFFFLLLYFWCNIVQIHLAELFINWNKGAGHRSAWASSYYLKHSWHGILCVCVF